MMHLIKPNKLNKGDKVATVTLSWGGPSIFKNRYEIGVKQLEDAFGVKVVPMSHTLSDDAYIYQNPQKRAQDLMTAFADPEIKAIISTIGGDETIRLLPYIDFDVIRKNLKSFSVIPIQRQTILCVLRPELRRFTARVSWLVLVKMVGCIFS